MAMVLMLSCVDTVFAEKKKEDGPEEDVFNEGYYSYIVAGKNAVIVGYCGEESDVVLPSKLGGHTVTGIRRNVFLDNGIITTVEIPACIKDISEEQFSLCPKLREIRVAEGNPTYTSIDGVLYEDKGKTIRLHPPAHSEEFIIPKKVTKIAPYAFFTNKNLTAVTIPDGVKEIGMCAFYDCEKVRTIILPKGIKKVGQDAFAWCINLKVLEVPETLSDIGRRAFFPTYATAHDENEFVTIGNHVLIYYSGEDTDVVVPDGVLQIADAFYGNTEIESVKLPDSVEYISDHAFYGCEELLKVNIPKNIKKIGEWAFFGCIKLKKISIPAGAEVGSYTFSCCYKIKEVSVDCENIPMSAFERCEKLEEVNLSENVKEIGPYAFYFCEALEDIKLPGSLETIGGSALRRIGAKKLKLGENITTIGSLAFWDNPDIVLTVARGSYAEQYVTENGLKHETVEPEPKKKDGSKSDKKKKKKKKEASEEKTLLTTQNIIIASSSFAVMIAVIIILVVIKKKRKRKNALSVQEENLSERDSE